MRIQGKKLDGLREEILVIPRQGEDIVFRAKAVLDYSDFDKLFPRPEPPGILRPGGVQSSDPTDPKYLEAINKWAENRMHWMVLQSLTATEDLEWETVDFSNPETWSKYKDELLEAGFSDAEQARIVGLVTAVNGLDQDRINEATARFLAEARAAQEEEASQNTAPVSTPSGEPVKDSA